MLSLKYGYKFIFERWVVKIGERGQVTIPQHLREAYALTPGTDVDFLVRDGALMLVKKDAQNAVADLFGRKTFDRPTDALMKLLRE